MSKTKKTSAAESLIDSLLEDIDSNEATFAPASEPEVGEGAPMGLEGLGQFSAEGEVDLSKIPDSDLGGGTFDLSSIPDADHNLPNLDGFDRCEAIASQKNDNDLFESPPEPISDATHVAAPEHTVAMSPSDSTQKASASTQYESHEPSVSNPNEKTVAVGSYANRNNSSSEDKIRSMPGMVRTSQRAGQVFTSSDASLLQAESLRIAQQRILELEQEVDRLRQENEELSSAAEIIKTRADELSTQIQNVQKEKIESEDSLRSEIMILKGNIQYRDSEIAKFKIKIEDLESRLKMDLKKIRVRERELENRLELSRTEKNAIVRSKDETILEIKRKMDQMQSEIDNYRQKCLELNKSIESNHESFKKTTRALRLALANLEIPEDVKAQLKKAD